jgi:hypothetical protein
MSDLKPKLTNHRHLTHQRSNVNQKIVAHVDARVCDSWIHNDALSAGFGANVPSGMACLVSIIESAFANLELIAIAHCSAISGEIQALKKPTPLPNKIKPRMNDARAPLGEDII